MCFYIIIDIFYCFYPLRTDFITCRNFHFAVGTWLFNIFAPLHLIYLFMLTFTFCFGLLVYLSSINLCQFSFPVLFLLSEALLFLCGFHLMCQSVWLCSPSCDCPNVFHLRLIAPPVSHCPPCPPLYFSLSSSLSLLVTLCVVPVSPCCCLLKCT